MHEKSKNEQNNLKDRGDPISLIIYVFKVLQFLGLLQPHQLAAVMHARLATPLGHSQPLIGSG
jgi:hypothetical protein